MLKDRIQVWMSRDQFQAIKGFLESTDEFDDRPDAKPLLDLYGNLEEATTNNSNTIEVEGECPPGCDHRQSACKFSCYPD